jgi:hypothetical protein
MITKNKDRCDLLNSVAKPQMAMKIPNVRATHMDNPSADPIDIPATIMLISRWNFSPRKLESIASNAIMQAAMLATWFGTQVSAFSHDMIGMFQPSMRPSNGKTPYVALTAIMIAVTGIKSKPETAIS